MHKHPRFAKGDAIARTCHGAVYRGLDHEGLTQVAIKTYSPLAKAESRNEACVLSALWQDAAGIGGAHPGAANVLHMLDYHESAAEQVLVLEWASGGELFSLVQDTQGRGLPAHQALVMFQQMAAGLSFIHDAGIAHLDISPENVLLVDDCTLKICDFGLSAFLDSEVQQPRGKCGYMAPEIACPGLQRRLAVASIHHRAASNASTPTSTPSTPTIPPPRKQSSIQNASTPIPIPSASASSSPSSPSRLDSVNSSLCSSPSTHNSLDSLSPLSSPSSVHSISTCFSDACPSTPPSTPPGSSKPAHLNIPPIILPPAAVAASPCEYDLRRADIYSLGMSLLVMLLGFNPVELPSRTRDPRFRVLWDHGLHTLLGCYQRADHIQPVVVDLLQGMLQMDHAERLSIQEVLRHPALCAV